MSCPTAVSAPVPDVWKNAPLFRELREPQSAGACGSCGHYDSCRGGCMAAKFFTGLPLDGPDPECVVGYGAPALAGEPRQAPSQCRPLPRQAHHADPGHAPSGQALQRKSDLVMARDTWFETVVDRAAARQEAPAQVRLLSVARRQREGPDGLRQRRGVRRARVSPRTSSAPARSVISPQPLWVNSFDAGPDLADRRAGGPPRRRGGGRPRRRRPRYRDGAVARSPASRSKRSSPPTPRRSSRSTGWAAATPSPRAPSGPGRPARSG